MPRFVVSRDCHRGVSPCLVQRNFELRKVALGTCGRDHGTPCAHENACVRCPLLRVDPAQIPRLQGIHANLLDRLREAKEQGWLGEVAAIETTIAAATQKLETMRAAATQRFTVLRGQRMSTSRPVSGCLSVSAASVMTVSGRVLEHGRGRSRHCDRRGRRMLLG
jgi:hypothetical protein